MSIKKTVNILKSWVLRCKIWFQKIDLKNFIKGGQKGPYRILSFVVFYPSQQWIFIFCNSIIMYKLLILYAHIPSLYHPDSNHLLL